MVAQVAAEQTACRQPRAKRLACREQVVPRLWHQDAALSSTGLVPAEMRAQADRQCVELAVDGRQRQVVVAELAGLDGRAGLAQVVESSPFFEKADSQAQFTCITSGRRPAICVDSRS